MAVRSLSVASSGGARNRVRVAVMVRVRVVVRVVIRVGFVSTITAEGSPAYRTTGT